MGPELSTAAVSAPLGGRLRTLAALVCAIAVLFAATPVREAHAQRSDRKAANKRLAHGLELYKDEDYDAAADEFAEAYQLSERPDILFAWAQAARMAGRCQLAAKLYERFIETSDHPEDARAARRARGLCQDREPLPRIVEDDPRPRSADRHDDYRASERRDDEQPRRRRRPRVADSSDSDPRDSYDLGDSAADRADQAVTAETDASQSTSRRAAFARVHLNLARGEAVLAPGLSLRLGAALRIFASALVGGNFGFEPGVEIALGKQRVQPYVSLALPVFFVDGARPGARSSMGLRYGSALAFTVEIGGSYAFSVPEGATRTVLLGTVAVERSF